MSYAQFRTGLTFTDVRRQLAQESDARVASGLPPLFVTRRTVIGRWREIKLAMWDYYQRGNGAEFQSHESGHDSGNCGACSDSIAA